ncbi:formylglycine-generating enzyme family protein [Lacipirellula parvula]|uniref:Sulfatase-modifying factor enzyme-like domain-containing protein n=1 Tax=Lacipirellula parvula TaxID=2650471 RepID=A0A5K7XJ70_9BACT|nr:SUMF1/EgtB/PvdO family nonheme iron enzyme [Lacipirellula parvula]BBO32909.1 hypothetical protein PLANPX_2521 [Lacipirellula parvula]
MRLTAALILSAFVASWATPAHAVSFSFAHVGNAGNAADPRTGLGAVAYSYSISKTEVTNAQYVEFLNKVDPAGSNALGLFYASMAGVNGGIEKTGATDGARYVARAGREQQPVSSVSFFHAMRFVNWLHNGQGNGGTESGVYTIGSGIDEVRSANAKFWIPSQDEWYKAAYHDSTAGTAGVYFDFPTGSNAIPISDKPADNPSAANYFNDDGLANGFNDGYAVSGSTSPIPGALFTDVGAYTQAASPYGTFDQDGNVEEWNESVGPGFARDLRGSSAMGGYPEMQVDWRNWAHPMFGHETFGFRVATVPEPGAAVLGAMAVAGLFFRKRDDELTC